jgi:hypothetical protein
VDTTTAPAPAKTNTLAAAWAACPEHEHDARNWPTTFVVFVVLRIERSRRAMTGGTPVDVPSNVMRRSVRLALHIVGVAIAMVLVAQCGGNGDGSSAAPPTTLLVTYGTRPTQSATMVCSEEARNDIAAGLGEQATVTKPTWVDHVYRCTYRYPTGSFTMSVKELPSIDETVDYFDAQKAKHPVSQLLDLGQEGFVATDATSVVRKDNKVLVVDVAKLPAQFGRPPQTRAGASAAIATLILGCWTGA